MVNRIPLTRSGIDNHIIRLEWVNLIRVFGTTDGSTEFQLNWKVYQELKELMMAFGREDFANVSWSMQSIATSRGAKKMRPGGNVDIRVR